VGEVELLVDRLNQVAGDFDFLCNKIVNGECRTLACLQRGGYDAELCRARGTKPPDPLIATCPALEKAGAMRRAATLLQQQAAPAPAVVPVPVAERPWEREGWCDPEGRCWWGRASEELCNSDWHLATRAEVEEFCSDCMPIVSLPYHALPIPQPTKPPITP
jgi:hypothetical protein